MPKSLDCVVKRRTHPPGFSPSRRRAISNGLTIRRFRQSLRSSA